MGKPGGDGDEGSSDQATTGSEDGEVAEDENISVGTKRKAEDEGSSMRKLATLKK